jgi:hypothetical protein
MIGLRLKVLLKVPLTLIEQLSCRRNTCHIGPLENPYEAFRLRDWQRVGQLYKQYAFRAARVLLSGILKSAGQHVGDGSDDPLYTLEEQQSIQRLEQALHMCECWDNGDLAGAYERSNQLSQQMGALQLPSAVTELHTIWPRADPQAEKLFEAFGGLELGPLDQDRPRNIQQSLYLDEQRLLVYAHDELAKISRLMNFKEDYRSALIRAAGLHENLITARVLRLWVGDKLFFYSKDTKAFSLRKDIKDNQRPKADKAVAQVRVGAAIPGLLWSKGRPPSEPDKFPIYQADHEPKLKEFWTDSPINWERFAELRNKAAHFCLQVPQTVAECAKDLAHSNLNEFEKSWRSAVGQMPAFVTDALPWDQLCAVCGVTFLPPQIEGGS